MRLSERTIAGLERAWAQGKVSGRPKAEDGPSMMRADLKLKAKGMSVRKIAAELDISPTTVQKLTKIAA